MHALNSILILLFLLGTPIFSFLDIRNLRTTLDQNAKIRSYVMSSIWYWAIAICMLMTTSVNGIFFINNSTSINWITSIVAIISALYIVRSHFVPLLLFNFSDKLRLQITESVKEMSYIFPTTSRQRYIFIIVPITVGICEEIIFRGYLFQYLQSSPYGLSAIVCLLLCTVIFGLGHYQQGISGIVETLILGYLLGFLYLSTGSLLLPIIIHILYDAKILYISWKLKNISAS